MKIKSTSPFGKSFKAEPKLKTMARTEERANSEMAAEIDAIIQGTQSAFKKKFPHGWCTVGARKSIGSIVINIRGGIIGDASLLPSRIADNDPAYFHLSVMPIKGGQFEMEHRVGFGIKLKPDPGTHYAMKTHKVKLRKVKGDSEKIVTAFEKHLDKLKKAVKDNQENFYRREDYPDKYFK